jgi:hypothetical protein
MSSVIVDNNVMAGYDNPLDKNYVGLYRWIATTGCLVVSQFLLNEYFETGNRNIAILIADLDRHENAHRIIRIKKNAINGFTMDRHYNYTCNGRDIPHARLCFLSPRKKIISRDNALVVDVNGFRKVDKIKPSAVEFPLVDFYAGEVSLPAAPPSGS